MDVGTFLGELADMVRARKQLDERIARKRAKLHTLLRNDEAFKMEFDRLNKLVRRIEFIKRVEELNGLRLIPDDDDD